MDTLLGIVGFIIIIAICWQLSRAGRFITKKSNEKVFARGAHKRGQDLVSQELTFTSRGSVAEVRQAILSTVRVAPSIPAVIHDAYLIKSTDTQVLYGAGSKLHQSFRGLLTLEPKENGTRGSWEILNWTLGDGIVANQSIMDRLIADINSALRSVDPNAVLRPASNASSSPIGATRSSSPPPTNKPTATSTLARPKSRDSADLGTVQHTAASAAPGSNGGSDSPGSQLTMNTAIPSTQARPNTAHIWLRTTTQSLDVCLTDRASTDTLAIFNQTRYLTLEQLKQRGMGVGRIKTNSRSDRSSIFEASILPAGEVTLTRGDEAASSDASPDSMLPHVQLTFSDLKASPDTVDSMVREISSGLRKKFEEISFRESST